MGVHDATAAVGLEPILILLVHAFQKTLDIRAVARREPVVHVGTSWIVVRHPRAGCKRIDIRKHKVSNVADAFAANVAPKVGMAFNVPKERVVVGPSGEGIVNGAMKPVQTTVT